MRVSRIETCRCTVGEGPLWDQVEQALYLFDIPRSRLHRLEPATGALSGWDLPFPPGAMALRTRRGAVLAAGDKVFGFDFASGETELLATAADQPRDATFNDGKVDRQGRFIIGSCSTSFADPKPTGGIFSFAAGQGLRRAAGDITFSNGPCFSPDGATLYFVDSGPRVIFAYEYDTATGEVGARRRLADTEALGGLPDGATVDADGLIWVAVNGGGKVAAFRPDGGLERTVDLPTPLAGSLMFGGPDLDQLFVTTIDTTYFGEPAQEASGYLYVVEGLGVRGLPEPRFAG